MASLVLFDLDLEDNLQEVYRNALDTIKYLEDVVKSIENRVLDGEEITGLKVIEPKGNRFITAPGIKYLAKVYGEDVIYEVKKSPIGITKLEALIGEEEMLELQENGYIANKIGKKKVILND